jgi:GH24 family phage-related lysozyme (muramidase)
MGPVLVRILAKVAQSAGRGILTGTRATARGAGTVARKGGKLAATGGAGYAVGKGSSKLSGKVFNFDEERAKRSLPPSIQPTLQSEPSFANQESTTAPIQAVNNTISNSGNIEGKDAILEAILRKLTSIESITGRILDLLSASEQSRITSEEKSAIKESSGSNFQMSSMLPGMSGKTKEDLALVGVAAAHPAMMKWKEDIEKWQTESSIFINDAIFAAQDYFTKIIDFIGGSITSTIALVEKGYEKIVSSIKELIAFGGSMFDQAQLAIYDLIDKLVKKGKKIGKAISELPIVKQIVEGFRVIFDWLDKIIPEPIKKAMGWAKETVSTTASKATEKIKSTAKGMMEGARNSNVLMNVFDNAFGGAAYDPNSPVDAIKPSKPSSGLESLIGAEEGLRLNQYNDVGGKATIGYGHLVTDKEKSQGYIQIGNEKVPLGQEITKEQAGALRDQDIDEHRNRAIKGVGSDVWEQLPKNAQDALTSYAFNVGRAPTGFREAYKQGGLEAAAKTISEGTATVNGEVHPVLKARRQREAELFLSPSDRADKLANSSKELAAAQQSKPAIQIQMPPQAPNMGSASKAGEGSTSFIPSPDAGFDPTLNVLKSSPMFMMG